LADAMLFASGAVNRKGSVTDGTSFSDFEKEEKEHGHSIYLTCSTAITRASAST
jgi:translation elongation factor EF-G